MEKDTDNQMQTPENSQTQTPDDSQTQIPEDSQAQTTKKKKKDGDSMLIPVLSVLLAAVGCFTAMLSFGIWLAVSYAQQNASAAPSPSESILTMAPTQPETPAQTPTPEVSPSEPEPSEPEPSESEPSETEPSESEPSETEPSESEPSETEPSESDPSETESSESDPSETEPLESDPGAGEEEWLLRLVNPWNYMPEGYVPPLAEYSPGVSVDERCLPDLQAMMDGCRAAGLSPVICSAYRNQKTQEILYRNKVNELRNQGLTVDNATIEAGKIVAIPGTSEHQLGLAVDIVDQGNQILNSSQENTSVQKWLMEHSWEYGFILRYPNNKSQTTGIIYEPWHYRYVGRDVAKEITRSGMCLEEYLAV